MIMVLGFNRFCRYLNCFRVVVFLQYCVDSNHLHYRSFSDCFFGQCKYAMYIYIYIYICWIKGYIKGCDSNFELNYLDFKKSLQMKQLPCIKQYVLE